MAQSTFLQLCQRTSRKCRVHHAAVELPTAVTGQTGEMLRIVEAVSEAWFQIQSRRDDWRFKRQETSFVTVDGQAEYTTVQCGVAAGTFGRWYLDSFRSYLTTAGLPGETPMGKLPYETWRNWFKLGTNRTAKTQPIFVTQLPNDGLGLGPVPLVGYTILGDYHKSAIRLAADGEIPDLPTQHSDMIIVYKAMIDYGFGEAAPEIITEAERGYARLLDLLEYDQLPEVCLAGGR